MNNVVPIELGIPLREARLKAEQDKREFAANQQRIADQYRKPAKPK